MLRSCLVRTGKSVWIYYALRRCLADRKPVVWLNKGTYHLFVEEGVYAMPADFQQAEFHTILWTLVDSDESKEGVPPYLVMHDTSLFVIYATSPAKERWGRLIKTVRPTRVIMNPWTRGEMYRA
jgi:hypothetical protein